MANALQESVFSAIDTLVSQRIDKLPLDKTVTATIVSCLNALTGEYKVSYNGGYMTAFANEGTSYNKGIDVYVLVPESDFTKPKYIVSRAQALSNDNNISFVSSALSNYNLIGRNIIYNKTNGLPKGLNSYYKNDAMVLYDRLDKENSLVTIDDSEFINNLKEAEAIMVEASFETRLPKEHKFAANGLYGVKFTLAFKDNSNNKVVVKEYEEKIDAIIIPNISSALTSNSQSSELARKGIEEVKTINADIWNNAVLTTEDKRILSNSVLDKLSTWFTNNNNYNWLTDVQRNEIEAVINRNYAAENKTNIISADQEQYVKYYDYVIDSNNMTGNPFLFTGWADQYMIYPIDVENFLYIQQIVFYSQDFVTADDKKQASLWGDDIFIKDLEIYGLRTITARNGDYALSLSMKRGSTFSSIRDDEKLEVTGSLKNKGAVISDSAMFYWFKEDNRISSGDENYSYYAGAGWRFLKEKKNTPSLVTSGAENRAYENKYLCVCVYQDTMILKDKFILYNDAAKRDLEITSSLGIKFSFDSGSPKLICKVDGRESGFEEGQLNPHEDSLYTFVWSKTDETGYTQVFNQTIEEIEREYENIINDKDELQKAGLLLDLKAKKQALQGVEFEKGKNWLIYPTKQIYTNSQATFKCSVYLKDNPTSESYLIGTAQLTLQNSGQASPTDFYIRIENGDQVFQYSESGVSPDDQRYQDPLEIKPLSCHFYYPSGEEVDPAQYGVKWLVPLDNTLIVMPKEGMMMNPATGREEWNVSQDYALLIKKNYDYQALNNQITCIVTFQGMEYTKETTLLFTKVGENGTNGTDIVAKAYAKNNNPEIAKILEEEMLTLYTLNNDAQGWNTGAKKTESVLDFSLYQRNEELDNIAVDWEVSGGKNSRSKYIKEISLSGVVTWDIGSWNNIPVNKRMFRNQIVRGHTKYDGNDYYSFLPIPVIDYKNTTSKSNLKVKIDAHQTLKSITYNADGRNPLYNKNQGIFVKFFDGQGRPATKYVVWYAEGGAVTKNSDDSYSDNPRNACFHLIEEKDSKEGKETLTTNTEYCEFYILPNDVYDGEYANNLVHGKVYSKQNGIYEADIYIPIYMSLNTYGLASLNAWDGNHIEINEDKNYILAPQIGAGIKDEETNTFTGIVMGKAQTYDSNTPTVGLLGYSKGKQSIFLDSETGNAIFGLPEQQASTNNAYTEGRIELIPGGESKIGMWNIGSRAIYNMTAPIENIFYEGRDWNPSKGENGDYDWYAPYIIDEDTGQRIYLDNAENKFTKILSNFKGAAPQKPAYSDYPHSSRYNVMNATMSIPYEAQGMILSANPAYISVKSMPLTEDNKNINWKGDNLRLSNGDKLEVEIDPGKTSVFSIYRHTMENGYKERYPIVGVDASGRFYSNALRDGTSTLGLGSIGAFGYQAKQDRWTGVTFEYDTNTLLKIFTEAKANASGKLFLSTGSGISNEYPRPIGIYGNSISLHALPTTNYNSTDSNHKIEISGERFFAGDEREKNESSNIGGHITLPASGEAYIQSGDALNIKAKSGKDLFIGNKGFSNNDSVGCVLSMSTSGTMKTITTNEDVKEIGTNGYYKAKGEYTLKAGDGETKFRMQQNTIWAVVLQGPDRDSDESVSMMQIRGKDQESYLKSDGGWNLTTRTGDILIKTRTLGSSNGIKLECGGSSNDTTNATFIDMATERTDGIGHITMRTNKFKVIANIGKYGEFYTRDGDSSGRNPGFSFTNTTNFENGLVTQGKCGIKYNKTGDLALYCVGHEHIYNGNLYVGPPDGSGSLGKVYANDFIFNKNSKFPNYGRYINSSSSPFIYTEAGLAIRSSSGSPWEIKSISSNWQAIQYLSQIIDWEFENIKQIKDTLETKISNLEYRMTNQENKGVPSHTHTIPNPGAGVDSYLRNTGAAEGHVHTFYLPSSTGGVK